MTANALGHLRIRAIPMETVRRLRDQGCDDQKRYPTEWARVRPQVLRAYRADGSIADGVRVTPGDDYDAAARKLLSDPDIAFLHARNVVFGCYMLEILRA